MCVGRWAWLCVLAKVLVGQAAISIDGFVDSRPDVGEECGQDFAVPKKEFGGYLFRGERKRKIVKGANSARRVNHRISCSFRT